MDFISKRLSSLTKTVEDTLAESKNQLDQSRIGKGLIYATLAYIAWLAVRSFLNRKGS